MMIDASLPWLLCFPSRHLSLDSQWQLRNLLILLLLVASAEHILTAKTSSDVRDDPPLHSIVVDRS